ncbi:hypothetical protein [Streptomyces sp. NPDC003717]|uniref:hypothetical protein n=1 Tax=Streptomyces sp. NPDC003717 TaxID=3154276 RepID=UPI0033A8EED2
MRRLACGVAVTVVLLTAGGVSGAGAAPGEEPDVAVVVYPDTGRTASWHAGEPDFDRLRDLLDPSYAGTEPVPPAWTDPDGGSPPARLTVLWGLTGVGGWPQTSSAPGGDVAMLRQDQLVVAGDGTPWVRTDPAPETADDDIRWHRASRTAYDRAEASGVLGERPEPPNGDDGPREAFWWAAAGLVAGVGGTLLARRAAARRDAGPPRGEPRHELIDL